jgi:integrase
MGRTLNRLSPAKIRTLTRDGHYADGGGLYLSVQESGRNKSWLFRYAIQRRSEKGRQLERWMGLGPIETISLAEAREAALQCRKLRQQGIDPIEQRNAARDAARVAEAKTLTFDQCVASYLAAHRPKWRSVRHSQQWENTLRNYASPILGRLPISSVDTALVMKVLEQGDPPLWQAKPETASRLRGRIEAIISWATVRGYRQGDNPARWTGYLAKLLPSRRELRATVHHAALPYREIGPFMALVRTQEGVVARAFEFLVLTAARSAEVLGARWTEFDLDQRIWTRPAARMKAGVPHRVPLSGSALAIVQEMWAFRQNEFVFPGQRGALNPSNFFQFLNGLGRGDVTSHGFRSTFRDWAGEQTNFPREVCEDALAHRVGNAVEEAYRRGDFLEKRRRLMEAWADFCERPATSGEVVPIRSA